nr:aldose epimerase family protein [uncultured Stomatobaculum sp.]
MAVKQRSFGTFSEGREAKLYELSNQAGACARFTDLGAAWVGMELPAGGGKTVDVILGYDDPAIYERNPGCLGAIVGRHANRIAGAGFTLDGKHCQLEKNQGENNLHSGPDGWWKRLFRAEVLEEENAVRFSLEEPDGAQGFPGALSFSVTYRLTAENAVEIHYAGTLTAGAAHTVFNPTNHAYFNLAGHAAGAVDGQEVRMNADYFTPTDAVSIPTGEVRAVTGTAFDFRQTKPIGRDIGANEEQLVLGHGYDHNFVVKDYDGRVRLVAEAHDPVSGRSLEVYTDRPGLQFYTANWLGESTPRGKGGALYQRRGGYCFETQCFPDALHHPDWVQPVIGLGETFRTTSIYRFGGFAKEEGTN